MKILKIIFATLTLLLASQIVLSQVVTFTPSFATGNDSLKVVLNAENGNGALEDFTGDVYLHTGLITSNSSNGSDWKYVPYDWSSSNERIKATKIDDNRWEFNYIPSIREFFGVTDESEEILQIAIVYKGFRNGSIVAEGKDEGNRDIFIDLSSGEADARLLSPIGDYAAITSDSSLNIVGIGSVNVGDLELQLWLNDNLISSTSEDTLKYEYIPDISDGNLNFNFIATNNESLSDTVSFSATVRSSNGIDISRPDGLREGITRLDETSIRLSLFAPKKEFVYVIGDFNDWTPTSEFLMNREVGPNDSTWFWMDINGLDADEDYAFQYFIDGEIRVADPYSELILDEFNDQYIPDDVFPNLKSYPYGKTSQAVTWVQMNKEEFEFQHTDYDKPKNEELIIYELLIRDFIEDHSYQTMIDTLDYLQNLGINAIEFMPLQEFDGNNSWGYNPSFHYALDKYYGTPIAFKRLVDEIHRRNMLVIIDMVFNHATGQNPLVRMFNSGGTSDPTPDNPFFFTEGQHDANVFNDMNHYYGGSEKYVKRVVEHWLTEYNVDGFRFDLSKGFSQKGVDWNQYNSGRIALWKRYADHMWAINPDTYIILEHYGTQTEENELSNYGNQGMMFWTGANVNHNYAEASMGYHEGGKSDLNVALPSYKNFNRPNLITYFESHDEQWLMFKNLSFGNSNGAYNIQEFETAADRMKLVGAFFFLLEGPKMFWQFGELGYGFGDNGEECLNDSPDCPDFAPGRTDRKPIRWDYNEDPVRKSIYHTWAALIELRKSSDAFTNPYISSHSLNGPIKFFRVYGTDNDAVVVGNFDVVESTDTFSFTKNGVWYDFLSKDEITVTDLTYEITLAPGEFKIYTSKSFDDIVVSNDQKSPKDSYQFSLEPNYPNPFNPSTTIQFSLAQTENVRLEVFDMLGRKVATLVNQKMGSGNYTKTFNAKDLSSGVYIYRIEAGSFTETRKMLLLK